MLKTNLKNVVQKGSNSHMQSVTDIVYIVISSQVLFHDGSLLHSQFNTQLLITVHNSSRILTHV
jgi:hypothetical protein